MLSLSGPEDPNFDSYVMDEFAGGNYDAEEQIAAFYAMIVDKLGDDVTLIVVQDLNLHQLITLDKYLMKRKTNFLRYWLC